MFKHIEHKPKVTFGVVEQIVKHTTYDYGFDGYEHRKEKISAIHVEIEDIAAGDWTLVASVDYLQGILTICDSKRFKDIPPQYGSQKPKGVSHPLQHEDKRVDASRLDLCKQDD